MADRSIHLTENTLLAFIEQLRPEDPEIRKQLDYGYRFDNQIIYIYEIRPQWDDPSIYQSMDFAKIRYYKTRRNWNLYWMRASGKWELYEPYPVATNLDKLLKIIRDDEYGCFFG